MALSGYTKIAEKKNGGIRLLGLINSGNITAVTLNQSRTAIISLSLMPGTKFAKYEFREDEAEYRETVTMDNGSLVVEHELRFLLEKMGSFTTGAVNEIIRTSYGGIVALVVTANNNGIIVGHSIEFEKERPLRLSSITGTTGLRLRDETGEIVTLRSEDVAKALDFEGNLNSLFQ